jgi:hypothetical protein
MSAIGFDGMRLWCPHTLLALLILEDLHGGEGSTTGEQLMAELALVVWLVLVVDLVVLLLALAPTERHLGGSGGWKWVSGDWLLVLVKCWKLLEVWEWML